MLCIEGRLTRSQEPINGSLTQDGTINGSLVSQLSIRATLTATGFIEGSLASPQGISASLTGNPISAYFSFSCPIDYIKSCMSLGGWDDNLGWDDELGWKD